MTKPTRVLLIDDDEEDCFITETLLNDAPGAFALTWRPGYAQGLSELETARFDVCFVDYQIGGETGLAFVERAKSKGIGCPMILLTGVGQRDVDIAASEVGAADFLDKANLTPTLIERAIRYAIAHSKALQALSEQTNVLETTLESIQAGIAAFDASGALITSNRRFDELMRELSKLRAERYEEPVISEDEFRRMLQNLLLQAPEQAIEIDGLEHKIYEFRSDPITGGGHVLLAVDVSAQKSLQSTLLKAKADAEAASQTKSAFLATMSHELRTPMNGVLGTAELLKITPLNPEQCQLVNTITTSGKALFVLIEDLLDISMIEQGKFGLQREDVDPSQLVAEALEIVHAAHRGAALEITTKIALPRGALFVGDARRIQQILVNLVGNAAKFAPDGEIHLSIQMTEAGLVRFSVRDEGPGIAEEQLEIIFERFVQAEMGYSRRHGGVGLGLAISKAIIEQMNGRISVESTLGEGAEFWFELPLEAKLSINLVTKSASA